MNQYFIEQEAQAQWFTASGPILGRAAARIRFQAIKSDYPNYVFRLVKLTRTVVR